MNEYKTYTDRIIQPTPIILGLQLLPFSIGHSLLLKAAKSKFLLGGLSELNINELITELVFLLLVCSTTYDAFKAEVQNGEFVTYLNKYAKDLIADIKNTKDFCLFLKINQVNQYLTNGTQAPLYELVESNEDDISPNAVEAEEQILSTLMTDCGYTRNECLNLPLTETLSAYLLYAFKQGTIKMISKEEYDLKQRIKKGIM